MLTNLLVAVAFVFTSFVAIAWLAYRAVRSKSPSRRVGLLLGACVLAMPYAYKQTQTLYRNALCDKLTQAGFPSASDTWESSPLGDRFTLQTQVEEHGLGVLHIHRRVTENASGRVVAQTLAFYASGSLVDEIYPMRVEPVGCAQSDSSFEEIVSQIRSKAVAE